MKIIFIAGTGRCGSTILDQVLAQIPFVVSVGELRYLWSRGIIENRLCGNGIAFNEDPKWLNIVNKLSDNNVKKYADKFSQIESSNRLRYLSGIKTKKKSEFLKSFLRTYSDELKRVFNYISDEFDSTTIIDSSKSPMHGLALSLIDDIDLRIIHIVRNRKAVAHSWGTPKFDLGKNGMMSSQSIRKSSIEWVLINRWIKRYLNDSESKYKMVSYEDFSISPKNSINEILDFAGIEEKFNPIYDDKFVELKKCHSISGNPTRFLNGRIEIKEDLRWKKKMILKDKMLSDIYGFIAQCSFFL